MHNYNNANITPIFAPLLYGTCKAYPVSGFQSSVGAQILDGDGNVITTVTAAVATHPGDKGFKVMASQTLHALFNSNGCRSYEKRPMVNGTNIGSSEIFQTGREETQAKREEVVANTLQWFLFPGEYLATITYPPKDLDRHGYLEVHTSSYAKQYIAIKQEIIATNVGWERMCRKSLLSATSLEWGAFEYSSEPTQFTDAVWNYTGMLGSKRIAEIYITVKSDFLVSPNSWSAIGYNFPFKCKIIQAYAIPCSQTTISQDYITGKSNVVRVGNIAGDLQINLASSTTTEDQTFTKGDVIYIKIIEL